MDEHLPLLLCVHMVGAVGDVVARRNNAVTAGQNNPELFQKSPSTSKDQNARTNTTSRSQTRIGKDVVGSSAKKWMVEILEGGCWCQGSGINIGFLHDNTNSVAHPLLYSLRAASTEASTTPNTKITGYKAVLFTLAGIL